MKLKTMTIGTALIACMTLGARAADEGRAGPVTFYRDVAPILQNNCQECHRPAGSNYGGMIAPMSLMTYEETRPWAKSIAREVAVRNMPPWDADLQHRGVFANERLLTDEQIATLVDWGQGGSARGNPADAPEPRTFTSHDGWLFGEPDLVVEMPEPYFIKDEIADLYTAHTIDLTEEMLPEDRWFVGFQCKPGNNIIHHFNLHLLRPVDGKLPPPPTRHESETLSPQGAGAYMGGTSSGSEANRYPEGYGMLLKKGSRVTFDIHYHKEKGPNTGVWDRSSAIGFKFADKPVKRIQSPGVGALMEFGFRIPPRDPNYKVGPVTQTYRRDADLIALMPHMHLRGSRALFEAFYPDGTSEVLLHVPNYDFSWQTVYYYKELKRVPAGTKIEYTAWFDNSPEKAAEAGFNPNREVRFGQPSTDEMMMGFVMSAAVDAPLANTSDEPSEP